MTLGVGIKIDHDWIDGDSSRLESLLWRLRAVGCDVLEMYVPALNWLRGGRPVAGEAERARALISQHGFRLALHAPNDLSLVRSALHREVMDAVLDLARFLRAERVVYHSAQIALHDPYRSLAPLPDDARLNEMWEQETEHLRRYGLRAAEMGLALSVENRDPHLWEISALAMHQKPAWELARYHQGLRLDMLAAQMEAVNLPNVGLCLDVGHAYLAARYWPEPDYLQGIRACAPWVRHVHFHDNFGRIDDTASSLAERLVFGEADCHLPPGWGDIPLAQVLGILLAAGYVGDIVLELRPRYQDSIEEAFAATRRLLEKTIDAQERNR